MKTEHSASTYHAGGNTIVTTAGANGGISVQAPLQRSGSDELAPPVDWSWDGKRDNDSLGLKVRAYLPCGSSFIPSPFSRGYQDQDYS
jgi:hypothetical protein